jgi:hypothetical protein
LLDKNLVAWRDIRTHVRPAPRESDSRAQSRKALRQVLRGGVRKFKRASNQAPLLRYLQVRQLAASTPSAAFQYFAVDPYAVPAQQHPSSCAQHPRKVATSSNRAMRL